MADEFEDCGDLTDPAEFKDLTEFADFADFAAFADFAEFVRRATGHAPHPYQSRLAAEGLPSLLQAPTGAGKTVAAVLPWLHRRLIAAPERTPRRLVYVLPARSLAEPTAARIGEWLARLGLTEEVGLHLLAGGSVLDGGWRRHPERTAILVGTQDVLLSRALMRGFTDNRRMAAVSYGLLHNDAQWVFDELHLFGPALATGVRLQRQRDRLGTAAPTRTLWLSSTWDVNGPDARELPDGPDGPDGPTLRADVPGTAVRRISRLDVAPDRYVEQLVRALLAAHVPGTRTIAVLNSLERARAVHAALVAERPGAVLLHPHVRSADRPGPAEPAAELIITTAAVEAGSDLSSRTLLTELAPWSSLVQRAGRCNRHGEHPEGGDLLWCVPPEGGGQPAVEQWLDAYEGQGVTAGQLFDARIAEYREPAEGLEQAELLALFDAADAADGTSAVDRLVCAAGDRQVLVAWRAWESGEPAEDEPDPGQAELCPVPLAELAPLLGAERGDDGSESDSHGRGRGWLRDPQDGHWRRAAAEDLRPGTTVLLDAASGGYLPATGWTPASRTPVEPAGGPPAPSWNFACTAWVSLDQHLLETEEEAAALLTALPELADGQREAVLRAARYHDLGKCHEVFQDMLRGGGGDPPPVLLAKSKAPFSTGTKSRTYFRHELVSALILLDSGTDFLIAYLAAAHHGHVRITARSGPDEAPLLLGVQDGDRTPEIELSNGEHFAARTLRTDAFREPSSWTERALALRDRADLGPFRLAYLETLVRVSDWRSSARHDGPVPVPLV